MLSGERKLLPLLWLMKRLIISIESISEFLLDKLARYKQPRALHIVDVLPRNPAGKVQKFALKDALLERS